MAATDFLKLVCDDEGGIMKSLFYENVRDWLGYNQINTEIKGTLASDDRDRFVLMNNGVTIIAKHLQPTGNKFTMEDFQVVNGCQTSHVLNANSELLTPAVRIPVRIICTQDEGVIESIITATNRQTEVTSDQFFALKSFAKQLEAYFKSFDGDKQIYYERRSHQYDSQDVNRHRVITHQNLVRAVGAMFLDEPHRTTKNYRALAEQVGNKFFREGDCLEPYYVSAYAAYRLDALFRSKDFPRIRRPGRYHILLVTRILMDDEKLSRMNSPQMKKRCEKMISLLFKDADGLLYEAARVVDEVAGGNWERDYIRTQPITDSILNRYNLTKGPANEQEPAT